MNNMTAAMGTDASAAATRQSDIDNDFNFRFPLADNIKREDLMAPTGYGSVSAGTGYAALMQQRRCHH